ncbi:MAG: ergothioneine biosynthesis protein EgtB [Polyangiaceae bacterium]|nr:ergothioneine biosynthesis protein EgtB [Polyangiaceae bacterium]
MTVTDHRETLRSAYRQVRSTTTRLCEPLSAEDYVVQSMPDASPAKWHLAHTTWFFETFLLQPECPGYKPYHPAFAVLFNSYYQGVGPQFSRPRRGLLSRPTVEEVLNYRREVDRAMDELFTDLPSDHFAEIAPRIELGINHEEQHQELLCTDLLHMFAQNPLDPEYQSSARWTPAKEHPFAWSPEFDAGLWEIGAQGSHFFFDNEGPRHKVYTEAFQLGNRLVTAGEYLNFINDGGYTTPSLWLSEGWAAVNTNGWSAPLYWNKSADGEWTMMTLMGRVPVDKHRPVCHVSHFEADAYARWAGARLPLESEWERAAHFIESQIQPQKTSIVGNFLDSGLLHPTSPSNSTSPIAQLFGDTWEWTASAYLPYPGFQPAAGAIGEYNGKFMSNQMVLRGGSCATPQRHIRTTYRNFFPSSARWQFAGIRLAK